MYHYRQRQNLGGNLESRASTVNPLPPGLVTLSLAPTPFMAMQGHGHRHWSPMARLPTII